MPAISSCIIDLIWEQFSELPPDREVDHPLGCHHSRIPDRVVFEKLVAVLVFGCAYNRIADETCSATTLRRRRDEWINAGVMEELQQIVLDAYDRIIGLDLSDVSVDCCIPKAPCGGQKAGPSPVDRGKQGIKRSVVVDANVIPLGAIAAPAPDLLRRDFAAGQPNKVWLADITYIPTQEGFLYLAFILDTHSRRIVGWSMDSHMKTELVVGALEMAVAKLGDASPVQD